tara:strand:- start:153 stop:548 length:396 start_codon:yes stop_codon:yes gene_type:complete
MRLILTILSLFFSFSALSSDFEISFEWGNLLICTSGNPNTVKNPEFEIKNVPEGTKWIEFKLVDLNVPSYNHGGGWVEYNGQNTVETGIFSYKSPCPPDGKHKYQWTAYAKASKGTFAKTISKASASKFYP